MGMTKLERLELDLLSEKPERLPAPTPREIEDSRLESVVEGLLNRQGDRIHTVCNDGWVTLLGSVENAKTKRFIAEETAGIPGVKGVTNHLRTR